MIRRVFPSLGFREISSSGGFDRVHMESSSSTSKKLYLHFHVAMATKLGRVVNYHEGLSPTKLRHPFITWSNDYISTTAVPMATKFGIMVTHLEGLLPIKSHDTPIKSHDPLRTFSCKMTWQTKTIISSLPQCVCPSNLAGKWLTLNSVCCKA